MLTNPVRRGARDVEEQLTHVSINNDAIDAFGEEHADDTFELPELDAPVFPSVGDWSFERTVDYFVVGNALNFCFNDVETGDKFEAERMGMEMDGAFGMWLCLYDETVNGERDMTDSGTLKAFDSKDFRDVFEPSNGVSMPLRQPRVAFLNNVGEVLDSIGSFASLVEQADGALFGDEGFVTQLTELTDAYGQDTRTFEGQTIRFDKRAQLTAIMLHGYYQHESSFEMTDVGGLTIPADYGVPNTLRGGGILSYDDSLAATVDAREELPMDSRGEVEIRLATVLAGDKLRDALNHYREEAVSIPQLDYFLWSLRRESPYNEHLTRTTAY